MQYIIAFCSRPEVTTDVISGVVVDPTGVKVRVTFGDSKSNLSQDIRRPHFVTNDDYDNNDDVGRRTIRQNAIKRFA